MTQVMKFTCDRCTGTREVSPDVDLPEGWQRIRGCKLCESCVQDLDHFLRGARIEYIAVPTERSHSMKLAEAFPLYWPDEVLGRGWRLQCVVCPIFDEEKKA